jgi:transposase
MSQEDSSSPQPNTSLPTDVTLCHAMIQALQTSHEEQQRRLSQLEYQLAQLLRYRFGPRSEKVDPAQLTLFDTQAAASEANAATDVSAAPEVVAETIVKEHKRRGGGRHALPQNLPRTRVEYGLSPAELACPCCGQDRTKFGEEISEQLEYVPASLHVIEHVRGKFACKHCQEQVVVASKPPQPIEKSYAGPGLLAAIISNKFNLHLPLYRLEEEFTRSGVDLSRATMCGWLRQVAELLLPLYELMQRRVLLSRVLHTDDTTVQVQDARLPHTRTARFWVYVGDRRQPYIVYDYTPSRKRDGPAHFLKSYRGYLQADAYGGYDGIYLNSRGAIQEVACWAHARRKFFEAKDTHSQLAHEGLARIGQLYALERAAKEHALTAEQVRRMRQQESLPKLAAFRSWLDVAQRSAVPKSPVAGAIRYALNQWEALVRYCEDGELAIDNNLAERAVKPLAIGRRNWLFCGNDRGGRTAAILFSMTQTAKRHNLDPFTWLRDLLVRLPLLQSSHDSLPDDLLTPLLPDVWQKSA